MNIGIVHAVKDDLVMLAVYNKSEDKVTYNSRLPIQMLTQVPQKMGVEPYNFSIKDGMVVQDVGKFSRLNAPHKVYIVLAEIRTRGGRCLGYRCMEAGTCRLGNLSRESIITQQSQIKTGTSMLQNAIIRDGKVNCYPNHPFEKIIVGTRATKPKITAGQQQGTSKACNKDMYTRKAEKLFGDSSFLSNERLSPEQKKILIDAKKRGVPVEYINNPDLSKDVMCFYAENIVSKELAKDCSRIIQNPKLSMEQVQELYQCAVVGVDYSDMCDENLSPADMEIKRSRRYMQMWGDLETVPPVDEELVDKCLSYAESIKMNK